MLVYISRLYINQFFRWHFVLLYHDSGDDYIFLFLEFIMTHAIQIRGLRISFSEF